MIDAFLTRLAKMQGRRPWRFIVVSLLVTVVGAFLATRLELKTRFDQLLPDSQPSVVELRRVLDRTAAASKIFVVFEGADRDRLRAAADALRDPIRAIGAPYVTSAEDGVQVARAFLEPRALLFADVADLEKLKSDVDANWDYEFAKSIGADFDDEPPPPLTADSIKARLHLADRGDASVDRFPDGYFQAKDGRAVVLVVETAIAPGDLARSRDAFAKVKSVVAAAAIDPSIRVSYAGDLVTGLAEYGSVKDDLVSVGVLGVGLVLAVVFLFYVRVRALVGMGVTIAAGLAWTFGVTELAIGHLNVATGFLFSIVAGNGINNGIIFMARYFEERRHGVAPADANEVAHRTTWRATITAALAAAASYGSLGVTDFRGFKHFAVIGAAGMMLCWIATYVLLPAVLLVIDRARPFVVVAEQRASFVQGLRSRGSRYDAPFGFAVSRAPRTLAILGLALAAAAVAVAVRWVRSDPMEYDMRKLQNDLGGGTEMYRVSALAREVLGVTTESGMIVLVDRLDQVAPLKASLLARRDAAIARGEEKPFEDVHTLFDFVPEKQAEKLPIAKAIAEKIGKAHRKGFLADDKFRDIAPFLPPTDLAPFAVGDLPEQLAHPFTEKDGIRGRIVYVEPTAGKNDNDLHYLMAWADSFRETKLPSGEIIRGSGRAVIFADMLRAIVKDIPKAIALSFAMTIVAVVIVMRKASRSAIVIGALVVGVAWLGGLLGLLAVKLNFLNFIALPITFGIGVDYAVNVMHRQALGGGVLGALRSTGGAVVLCSLTTILGYLALLQSINQAVRGLGLVAVLGEVCCLLPAIVVLPAALLWRERARSKSADHGERPGADARTDGR